MPKKRSHGEGAYYYIPSRKLYRRVLDLGKAPDGKRIQLAVTARTADACLAKYEALKQKVRDSGGLPPGKAVTFPEWAKHWLTNVAVHQVDPKTYATYRSLTNNWLVPHLRRRRVDQIKPSDVAALRAFIVEKSGRATATARQAQVVLSQMMDAAVVDRIIATNPCEHVRKPRGAKVERGAIPTEQAIAILGKAAALPDDEGSRWWLKLLCGLRQGEILGATIDSLDLEHGVYEVSWKLESLRREHGCGGTCGRKRGADCPKSYWLVPDGFEMRHLTGAWCLTRPKSKAGRVVPLVPSVAESIRRYLASHADTPNPHGLIWRNADGSPISPKDDAAEWRSLLVAAGVITEAENRPGGTVLTGHWARHTTVTVLAEQGVDFQLIGEIVGHSSAQVTAIYRHARAAEKRAAMELVAGVWKDALPAQ